MKLIDEKTGNEVKVGDEVTTFRGNKGILNSFNYSRVYVRENGMQYTSEFFPSVINCKVVD
jgi:hypothetical protein